jgi:hypothetical protein
MVARLGNVLFWLGVIIALGWLALSYFGFSTRPSGGGIRDVAEALTVFGIPTISIAVGWALRYILAGR